MHISIVRLMESTNKIRNFLSKSRVNKRWKILINCHKVHFYWKYRINFAKFSYEREIRRELSSRFTFQGERGYDYITNEDFLILVVFLSFSICI